MYIKDGSNVDYAHESLPRNCIYSWGWIGDTVPLTTYHISPQIRAELIKKFKNIDKKYVMDLCVGHHTCEICKEDNYKWNGSIRIFYENKIYTAPAGVYHYIEKHIYTPPHPVVEAIKEGKFMTEEEWETYNKNDQEYQKELNKRKAKYLEKMKQERIKEEQKKLKFKKQAQNKLDRINQHMNSGDKFDRRIKQLFMKADIFGIESIENNKGK